MLVAGKGLARGYLGLPEAQRDFWMKRAFIKVTFCSISEPVDGFLRKLLEFHIYGNFFWGK